MIELNRRQLLATALVSGFVSASPVAAASKKALLKLSCNLYTFNSVLTSGEMSLTDVFDYCAELGFEAVDPTGYYFTGYPKPPAISYINQIKRHAFMLGLDISGTGVRNNFTVSDPAKLKADIEHVKQWVEVSAQVGSPLLRVFAGKYEGTEPEAEVDKRLIDCLAQCAEYASRFGVIIALQNHRDFIDDSAHFVRIIQAVGSPWIGAHLDIGGFRTQNPYADIAESIKHAVNWQIKENVFVGDQETPTDLPRLIGIMRQHGFRGYLPLETLGAGDPRQKITSFLSRFREALKTSRPADGLTG